MVGAVALGSTLSFASTGDATAIQRLLDQGKLNDAAQLVQTRLKQNPADVQTRFLQGVIAAEQQKYAQAIQLFTALTQEYPALPEPYNNLAVLYAARGEERKAAQVLEQAIRTNPSYATAHENLGDLYARMASDAYAKALQLDSSRQAAQPKLALIRQIHLSPAVGTAPAQPVTASPAAPVAPAAPARSAEAAKAPAAAPVTAPAATTAVAAAPQAPPTPARKADVPTGASQPTAVAPEPAKPAPATPAPVKTDDAQTAKQAVRSAVAAWAKAWAQQDMNGYYAAYSEKFQPQGQSLSAWKAERKDRIVGKPEITVDIQDLKITVQGTRAEASFRQHYASGGYKASTRKILRMHQESGQWRIIREETGR